MSATGPAATGGEGRLRAFADDVRALPRAAWVVYAGTFINRFGSFVVTFIVLILVRRGFSPAQAGLAASMYGFGGLGAAALGGHLADRIGRRRTIALSMFSSAASLLALSQARGLAPTMIATALVGVCAEMYRPAASALLADVTPAGRRVGTYALYRTAINAGFAIGPAVAGFLAARSPTLLFVADGATSVVYGVLILLAIPREFDRPAAAHVSPSAEKSSRPSALRLMAGDRGLLAVLATGLMVSFVHCQSMSTLPLEIRFRGYTMDDYGVLISINGLVCMLLELPIAALTSRVAAWIPMAIGAALTGVGMGAMRVAPGTAAIAACIVIWTLGEICYSPVASAFVADLAPAGVQGRYQAAWGLTSAGGLMLAPAIGPALFAASRDTLWGLCLALGLTGAATFVALGRARHVRTVRAGLAAVALPE